MSQSPQDNIFNVHFLGSASLPHNVAIETATLQKYLLDLYCAAITPKKPLKLPTARLTLVSHGVIVAITKGKDEYFSLKDIFSCSALVFTGSKVKSNKKKTYTYLFDNIKPTQQQSLDQNLLQPPPQWSLFKTQKYLLNFKHHPLIACLIRRKNNPLEIHVFVCQSGEQALSFSYSVDLARRIEIENPSPVVENYRPIVPSPNPFKQANHYTSSSSSADPELPEVIRKLEILGGGKGTVVNPVVKTTNVNLIENAEFFHSPSGDREESKNDFGKSDARAGQRKSTSNQQLNNLSIYHAESFEDFFKNKELIFEKDQKRLVNPPSQLSIYSNNSANLNPEQLSQKSSQLVKRKSQNVVDILEKHKSPKPASRSTTFMPSDFVISDVSARDRDGMFVAADNKSKPVAKVQPHKVTGVKVFPDGHDRTFLLPDRDKLRKVEEADNKPSPTSNNKNNLGNNSNRNSPSNKVSSVNYYNYYNNRGPILPAARNAMSKTPPMQAARNKGHFGSTDNLNNKVNKELNGGSKAERSGGTDFKDIWWPSDNGKKK